MVYAILRRASELALIGVLVNDEFTQTLDLHFKTAMLRVVPSHFIRQLTRSLMMMVEDSSPLTLRMLLSLSMRIAILNEV